MVTADGSGNFYIGEVDHSLWEAAEEGRRDTSLWAELDDYRVGIGKMTFIYSRECLVPKTGLGQNSAQDKLVKRP
jgi:hypothetical protein